MPSTLTPILPRWVRGTNYVSGGVPGRSQGVTNSSRDLAMRAYRSRTTLAPRAAGAVQTAPVAKPGLGPVTAPPVATPAATVPSPTPAPVAKVMPPPLTPMTAVASGIRSLINRVAGNPGKEKRVNSSDTYRQNFSGNAPVMATADLPAANYPAGEDPRAPKPVAGPSVTVTEAPRPTLPESYDQRKQRMRDEFHARQAAGNAALVAKYRQGDADFAANSTPSQKVQADAGFASLMKKRKTA